MCDMVSEEKSLLSALHQLSNEEFTLSDDTVLDKLFVHVEKKYFMQGTGLQHLLHEIGQWLEIIFARWNESEIFDGVKIFSVRLAGLIGSTSEGLEMLREKDLLLNLEKLAMTPETQNDSYIMVPVINTFATFLSHRDGWHWVSDTKIWKYVIISFYEDQSIYIRRSAVKFIALLLKMSAIFNSEVGLRIMFAVCEPLIVNNLLIIETHNELEKKSSTGSVYTKEPSNSNIYIEKYTIPIETLFTGDTVIPSVEVSKAAKLLADILENAIMTDAPLPGKLSLTFRHPLGNREGELGSVYKSVLITDILNNCSTMQDHQTYSSLLLMLNLIDSSRNNICSSGLKQCNLYITYENVYSIIQSMICKNYFHAVNNFCVTSLSWCNKIKRCYSECRICIFFETTIVNCLRIGLLNYCRFHGSLCKNFLSKRKEIVQSYVEEELYDKMLSECLARDTQKLSSQYTLLGVMSLSRILNFITNKSNIVRLFTDVANAVEFLTAQLEANQSVVSPIILHVLTLASELIEKNRLQYEEVVEEHDENLFVSIVKIISVDCYDVRITITSLQLLCKLLKIHIMPELLSKNNRKNKDVILQLEKLCILICKLNCTSWEIRDTTIEVFQTIVELTELTPWLFIGLIDSSLLTIMFNIACNDESGYVRGSAMIFFSKAVLAKEFSHLISPSNLLELAEKTAKEDEMPVARRAACQLVTSLYISYVPKLLNDANRIYEAMFFVTGRELDWEVKKAAIMFWRCVIDKLFMAGTDAVSHIVLPYSKIIPKDHSCSNSILNNLGEIGCLKAIWLGISDECDITVSEEAQNVVCHLLELDKAWNFIENLIDDSTVEEIEGDNQKRNIRALKPKVFFTLLKTSNWKDQLNSRKDWIENSCDDLNSLLDLILNVDNKVNNLDYNAIDCY